MLCNKLDVEGAEERFAEIKKQLKDENVLGMSIFKRSGMNEVRKAIIALVDAVELQEDKQKAAAKPQKSAFMAERSVCDTMEVQYPGQE